MAQTTEPRVPWSEVRAAVAVATGRRWWSPGAPPHTYLCARWVADRLAVHVRTVDRWATAGMPVYTFDRLVVGLGCHPAEVWDGYTQDTNAA